MSCLSCGVTANFRFGIVKFCSKYCGAQLFDSIDDDLCKIIGAPKRELPETEAAKRAKLVENLRQYLGTEELPLYVVAVLFSYLNYKDFGKMLEVSKSLRKYLRSKNLQEFWLREARQQHPLFDFKYWSVVEENKFDLWLRWQKAEDMDEYWNESFDSILRRFSNEGFGEDMEFFFGFEKSTEFPITMGTYALLFPVYGLTPDTLRSDLVPSNEALNSVSSAQQLILPGKATAFFQLRDVRMWIDKFSEFPFWSPDIEEIVKVATWVVYSDNTSSIQFTLPLIDERYTTFGLSEEKVAECSKWLSEFRWTPSTRPPIALNTQDRFDFVLKNVKPLF